MSGGRWIIEKSERHPDEWPVIPVLIEVPFTVIGWYGFDRPVEYSLWQVRELRAPANGPLYLGKGRELELDR